MATKNIRRGKKDAAGTATSEDSVAVEVDNETKKEAIAQYLYNRSITSYADNTLSLSKKEKKVVEVLDRIRGVSSELSLYMLDLVKLLDTELKNIQSVTDTTKFVAMSVIVPTANDNSHDYPLGQPVLFTASTNTHGYKLNGTTGNELTARTKNLRRPTLDEVRTVVDRHFDMLASTFITIPVPTNVVSKKAETTEEESEK